MPSSRTPALLVADPSGKVLEHPRLLATVRVGRGGAPATRAGQSRFRRARRLVHLPGRRPVGVDPETGELVLVSRGAGGKAALRSPRGRRARSPGLHADLSSPGEVKADGPVLPQWAYTAAAWGGRRGARSPGRCTPIVARTGPGALLDRRELKARVEAHRARFPENRVLQAARDLRARLPLLHQPERLLRPGRRRDPGLGHVQRRLRRLHLRPARRTDRPPRTSGWTTDRPPRRWREVGARRTCARAGPRTMVSFGQGCEGEPLTRWRVIAEAIRLHPRADEPGLACNINTNASLTARARGALRRRPRLRSASRSTRR